MKPTTWTITVSPQARLSYLALASISRGYRTTASRCSGQYHRSDFANQGFTGVYEAGQPTGGPLGEAPIYSTKITPKMLKAHLDQFVVGQERAKKVMSVAVYNHYQRIQEMQRREDEEEELLAAQARRDMGQRHPVEGNPQVSDLTLYPTAKTDSDNPDEFPGQQHTVHLYPPSHPQHYSYPQNTPPLGSQPLNDTSSMTLEKSNILMLGPSGVGKTLIAKTLARVLEVPFSMSDCTPFTQAGYIGEDADVCIARLLSAANWDVAKAERGIVCLDEIDKIAMARVSHGKDVSGEGVQQALLKIVEGTTVQVTAKSDRNTQGGQGPGPGGGGGVRGTSPLGGNLNNLSNGSPLGGGPANPAAGGGNKGDVFNVRTDNILFICTGAFIGLHKMILDRVSKGSMGFGASVRSSSPATSGTHDTMLTGEDELFRKHLPFYTPLHEQTSTSNPPPPPSTPKAPYDALVPPSSLSHPQPTQSHPSPPTTQASYNILDLVTPSDLQKYGLIPELIGRIPVTCAVAPLTHSALVRVLTEPRNSLLRQYEQLFALSGAELRFTTPALWEVASQAREMGTGARGLRTVMERLLGEGMFDVPGSPIKHVLVTADVAKRKSPLIYFSRGQQQRFFALIAAEEEAWEAQQRGEGRGDERPEKPDFTAGGGGPGRGDGGGDGGMASFEEYREKAKVAGIM
ncbi:MAG: hypothetical protein M1820_008567 [Bogoriella megaspora]|nr:MAG: hypothetical protein M1820_008567 [Bogoriella megaspora]